jgi:RHS repeat-associated protein
MNQVTYWKKADGTEMQYVYDILDRLYQVPRNGTNVLQNSYDPFGRRIAKTEVIGGVTNREYYVYEGMSVIAVLDPAGRIKESFTRGPGIAGDVGSLIAATDHTGATNKTVYLHSDQRGNVIAARSGTNTVGTWSYDAWGVQTTNTGAYVSRFLFSSKELDRSTGLYHYGFRDYAPELKRWISADPLGEVGGLNLYAFCDNDPINAVDPDGLTAIALPAVAVGNPAVAAVAGAFLAGAYTGHVLDETFGISDTLGPAIANGIEMLRNAGERGRTAKPEGTANPWKHRKPYPGDPTKMLEKDPHTGKWKIKPKPPNAPWTVIPPILLEKNNDGGSCENK